MKSYLRTTQELVTDPRPTTAGSFWTNFKTCKILHLILHWVVEGIQFCQERHQLQQREGCLCCVQSERQRKGVTRRLNFRARHKKIEKWIFSGSVLSSGWRYLQKGEKKKISKHNLLIMFRTLEGTYQFSRTREAAASQTPPPNTVLSRLSSAPLFDSQIFAPCTPLTRCCSCTKPHKTHAEVPALLETTARGMMLLYHPLVQGTISFPPTATGYGAIQQEEGKARSMHKAQPFPQKPSLGCPAENPGSVHQPDARVRAALPRPLLGHVSWKTTARVYEKRRL